MKTRFVVATAVFLFFSGSVFAQSAVGVAFLSNLSQADAGSAVLSLQKLLNSDADTRIADSGAGSPGFETGYFGALTKNAVVRFQEKYKSEVLTPAGLSRGTGYVGAFTIKKLNQLAKANTAASVSRIKIPSPAPAPPPYSSANNSITPPSPANSKSPAVYSVSPDRVRRGDVVVVTGENFTPANNTVTLGDGLIQKSMSGLLSLDGKTITFVFQPPEIQTMTEEQIRALPNNAAEQIEGPLKAAGKTLSDVLTPYKGVSNESELRTVLQKNGHSFDELYNFYFITVDNANGKGASKTALLHGLRNLPVPGLASEETPGIFFSAASFGKYLKRFLVPLFPVAHAQGQSGGGFNTGIVMICTCGDGYMTFMTDFSGKGTGLYVFSWGFMADAGSGTIGGMWLGGYQTMGGSCSIYAGITCFNIPGNSPRKPWGSSL